MHRMFIFFDELRPAGDAPIRVLARVPMLTTHEGRQSGPFTAKHRPNQNFGGRENRHFYIGQVEVAEGEFVYPGESREFIITFLNVVGIVEQLSIGRRWRIQEGPQLVAKAELWLVLPAP
jgi:translation elongation factor EF-Tu-like GTPase